MRVVDLIARKRDGEALGAGEIAFFVREYTAGRVPDYQASALLMAVFFSGMERAEIVALTGAMLDSGARLDLSGIGRPVADKHSTGGVGDKTSLVVAPIAAAAGLAVPMISGRALGHSGGTLDKLESIPGFRTGLSLAEFRSQLDRLGVAMSAQTEEIAPADRKLYALRDATATVPSIPLIASSIMSKKLAEGLDALVLDVKVGSGAFMKERDRARALAGVMRDVGNDHGTRTRALLTSMDQPLGRAAGNGVEVAECVDVLGGGGPADLVELSVELAAQMIALGASTSVVEACATARDLISSGAALECFRRMVEAQGGDPGIAEDPSRLPKAPVEEAVHSDRTGFVSSIDTEALGWTVMRLGAGRDGVAGQIDHGVGLLMEARLGDAVRPGDPLCRVLGRDAASAREAARACGAAITISEEPPPAFELILETLE